MRPAQFSPGGNGERLLERLEGAGPAKNAAHVTSVSRHVEVEVRLWRVDTDSQVNPGITGCPIQPDLAQLHQAPPEQELALQLECAGPHLDVADRPHELLDPCAPGSQVKPGPGNHLPGNQQSLTGDVCRAKRSGNAGEAKPFIPDAQPAVDFVRQGRHPCRLREHGHQRCQVATGRIDVHIRPQDAGLERHQAIDLC